MLVYTLQKAYDALIGTLVVLGLAFIGIGVATGQPPWEIVVNVATALNVIVDVRGAFTDVLAEFGAALGLDEETIDLLRRALEKYLAEAE